MIFEPKLVHSWRLSHRYPICFLVHICSVASRHQLWNWLLLFLFRQIFSLNCLTNIDIMSVKGLEFGKVHGKRPLKGHMWQLLVPSCVKSFSSFHILSPIFILSIKGVLRLLLLLIGFCSILMKQIVWNLYMMKGDKVLLFYSLLEYGIPPSTWCHNLLPRCLHENDFAPTSFQAMTDASSSNMHPYWKQGTIIFPLSSYFLKYFISALQ